jgi:hypothetical protein
MGQQVVTATGDYQLTPVESFAGTRLLTIRRPNGQDFQLEYRQPHGHFEAATPNVVPGTTGVQIRLAPYPSEYGPTSDLLDMSTLNPSSPYANQALAPRATFTDYLTGVSITTVSSSPSGADVHVEFPNASPTTTTTSPPPTTTPPTTTSPATTSTNPCHHPHGRYRCLEAPPRMEATAR